MINKIFTIIPPDLRIKAFMLIAIFVLYAFFSSSTPDSIGIPEILIGVLLVAFVGISVPIKIFGGFLLEKGESVIPKYVYISFLLLLLIPTSYGLVIHGNSISNAIRDIIPFIYLFLPLFFLPHMTKNPDFWLKLLITLLCLVGVAYSVRFFLTSGESIQHILSGARIFCDAHYFQQDPAVLFASTYLLCLGLYLLIMKQDNLKNFSIGFIVILLGRIAFASLMASLVRGQIILVALSLLIMFILFMTKKPVKTMVISLIAILVLFIIPANFQNILYSISKTLNKTSQVITTEKSQNIVGAISQKTANAGVLNSRDKEMYAVIDNMKKSTQNFILGEGWGGTINSQASGGMVRYTHNVLLYFILKTGLIGLALITLYAIYIANILIRITKYTINNIFSNMPVLILLLSLMNVLFLDSMVEPGYKMFSFGVLLTITILLGMKIKQSIHDKN